MAPRSVRKCHEDRAEIRLLLLVLLAGRGEERGQHAFLAVLRSPSFSPSLFLSFLSGSHDLYARAGEREREREGDIPRRATCSETSQLQNDDELKDDAASFTPPFSFPSVPLSFTTRHDHGDAVRTGRGRRVGGDLPRTPLAENNNNRRGDTRVVRNVGTWLEAVSRNER